MKSGLSDIRSNTAKNCRLLKEEYGANTVSESGLCLKERYSFYSVPDQDTWRPQLLMSLLQERNVLITMGDETDNIDGLITSLCET